MKEIRANGKGSYTDFGLCIKSRTISLPKKKIIKEDIPFKNGSYDFSSINGEIYWENREIQYVFDISDLDFTVVELLKERVVDWLLNIHETQIEDDYNKNYYYFGSFDSDSWKEEWEQSELSVKFSVYPYKYGKTLTTRTETVTTAEKTITINNESSHRIIPTMTVDANISLTIGENTYALTSGTHIESEYLLNKGDNIWKVKTETGTANMNISYRKEVF